MANTRLFLDTRRVGEGKPGNLKIAIAHRQQTAYIPAGIKLVSGNEWDKEKGKVIRRPDRETLNARISSLKGRIDSIILQLSCDGRLSLMSASEIREYCENEINPEKSSEVRKKRESQNGFLYRFSRYAERMKPGTRRTFDHTLNRLMAYLGSAALEGLRFEDMTVEWLSSFDAFMSETSKSRNSRNIHFRNIRTVFNAAIEDGVTTFYPFRRFKIKGEVTANRDLTVEELRRLIYFDCEACARKYRDYFVLMFLLMGINNVDLCHLQTVNRGRVEFHRKKTGHFFSMKIEPEAQELIDRYHGRGQLLDILDHWSSDEFFRKKMNKHLQKIGPVRIVGRGGKKEYTPLFPKLTTYYARHTWASIASSLDIPIETISAGLGHEYGNRITAIYINYDNRKIDVANRRVIDWVFYGMLDGRVVVSPGTPEFYGLSLREAHKLGLVTG